MFEIFSHFQLDKTNYPYTLIRFVKWKSLPSSQMKRIIKKGHLFVIKIWSSRKAWLYITTLVILFWEEEKEKSLKQTFHTRFWTIYNLCELTTQVHKFQRWFFNQKPSFEHWFIGFWYTKINYLDSGILLFKVGYLMTYFIDRVNLTVPKPRLWCNTPLPPLHSI